MSSRMRKTPGVALRGSSLISVGSCYPSFALKLNSVSPFIVCSVMSKFATPVTLSLIPSWAHPISLDVSLRGNRRRRNDVNCEDRLSPAGVRWKAVGAAAHEMKLWSPVAVQVPKARTGPLPDVPGAVCTKDPPLVARSAKRRGSKREAMGWSNPQVGERSPLGPSPSARVRGSPT